MRSVALIVETNSLTGAHDRSTTCSFHLRWDCLQLGWRFPLLFYTLSSLPQTSLPLLPWLLGRYTRTPYLSRQFSIASWYPIANILHGSVLITASTSARRSRNPEWHYPPESTFALKEWLSPPALTRTLLEQQVTLKQQTTFIWINWTWEWKHNQLLMAMPSNLNISDGNCNIKVCVCLWLDVICVLFVVVSPVTKPRSTRCSGFWLIFSLFCSQTNRLVCCFAVQVVIWVFKK